MPDGRTIGAPEDGLVDDIPPYLRKPVAGTIEAGQFWLSCIHAKLRKLEALGLRPHPAAGEQGGYGALGAWGGGWGDVSGSDDGGRVVLGGWLERALVVAANVDVRCRRLSAPSRYATILRSSNSRLPMKIPAKLSPVTAALLVILCIFVLWGSIYPIASYLPPNVFQEPLNSSYNVLNVLFTALAFGGVIITLIFQAQEAKNARSEAVERSILEMFQILTSAEFQATKNSAFRVLIAAIKNRDYGEYVASRLFAVDQLSFPRSQAVKKTLCELDSAKHTADDQTFEHLERHDRLKLDDMMNFFSMLAQRESSKSIVNHVDFAYDWWRPALMLIAQLQKERKDAHPKIQEFCKNRLVNEIIWSLDIVYGHEPIKDDKAVWAYLCDHPLLNERFKLDPDYGKEQPVSSTPR